MNYREYISFRPSFSQAGYGLYFCKEENGKMFTAKPLHLEYVENPEYMFPPEPTIFVPNMKKDMLHKLVDDLMLSGIGGYIFEKHANQESARKDHIKSLETIVDKLILRPVP